MKHAIAHLKADYKRAFLRRPSLPQLLWASLTHPHFAVLARHRLAMALWHKGSVANVIARFLHNRNTYKKGVDIAHDAYLGPGLVLPRAVGVIIGGGTKLGANVTLHHEVMLGSRLDGPAGNPVIGDNVVIHAGACVLGRVKVGEGAVIGTNVRVIADVPPGTVLYLPPLPVADEAAAA